PPPLNQEINTFNIINVTDSGISLSSSTIVDNATVSEAGAIKISPNGQHLSIADNGQGRIFLYDINLATDSIEYTSFINTGFFGSPNVPPYSLEYSPDSQILYFSNGDSGAIYKYLIFSESLVNDKVFVGGNSF